MSTGVVAVTGASGYVGSRVLKAFDERGWCTIPLVRHPSNEGPRARRFALDDRFDPVEFADVGVLVHCAYDFSTRTWQETLRVNVEGSKRVLTAARDAGVKRIIVLSSMSAYDGTQQQYGRAKLEIERIACDVGACVVRPGLVYGPAAGGMVGALSKLARLRVVPVTAGRSYQFMVHEDDLAACLVALATARTVPVDPVCVFHPSPVPFGAVVRAFSPNDGRRRVYVPVPWQAVFLALRAAEFLGAKTPFRSDSLVGLVRPAPQPVASPTLERFGVRPRPFSGLQATCEDHT